MSNENTSSFIQEMEGQKTTAKTKEIIKQSQITKLKNQLGVYNFTGFQSPESIKFVLLPTFYVDKIMPHLPEKENKIMIYLFRKTLSLGKKTEKISLNQMLEGTGVKSKSHLCKALKNLEWLGLITKDIDSTGNLYKINFTSNIPEETSAQMALGSAQMALGGSAQMALGSAQRALGGAKKNNNAAKGTNELSAEKIKVFCDLTDKNKYNFLKTDNNLLNNNINNNFLLNYNYNNYNNNLNLLNNVNNSDNVIINDSLINNNNTDNNKYNKYKNLNNKYLNSGKKFLFLLQISKILSYWENKNRKVASAMPAFSTITCADQQPTLTPSSSEDMSASFATVEPPSYIPAPSAMLASAPVDSNSACISTTADLTQPVSSLTSLTNDKKFKTAVKRALDLFSEDTIYRAIDNYISVVEKGLWPDKPLTIEKFFYKRILNNFLPNNFNIKKFTPKNNNSKELYIQLYKIYKHWNSKRQDNENFIICTESFNDVKYRLKKITGNRNIDDIIKAIDNYVSTLKQGKVGYYTLIEFLYKIDKFMPQNFKNDIQHLNSTTVERKPDIPYDKIIEYFNRKTGKNFAVTDTICELINKLVDHGYRGKEFQKVIDTMSARWKDNPRMNIYLSPHTLFKLEKFEIYLNADAPPLI